VEGGHIALEARGRNRGQVNERVKRRIRGLIRTGRRVVLAKEDIDRLAIAREIDPDKTRTTLTSSIKVDDLMPRLAQLGNNAAPQLARPARDGDPQRDEPPATSKDHSSLLMPT